MNIRESWGLGVRGSRYRQSFWMKQELVEIISSMVELYTVREITTERLHLRGSCVCFTKKGTNYIVLRCQAGWNMIYRISFTVVTCAIKLPRHYKLVANKSWHSMRYVKGKKVKLSLLQAGGKIVSLRHRPLFTPQEYSWYSLLLQSKSTPGP
jgi:hypothetical protein